MPPRNASRSLFSEEGLARRIAFERERRGMSYEGLARRMTDAGCAINQSAIYKIEKGTKRKSGEVGPPRRITVDELVALAEVFETSVEQLLLPQEAAASEEFASLLRDWDDAAVEARHQSAAARDARSREIQAFERMRDYVAKHPEIADTAAGLMQRWAADHVEGDAPAVDPLLRVLFGKDAALREQYLRQTPTSVTAEGDDRG